MNVNRIDSEAIKAQAKNLLQNKAKVDLKQEDLEVLWQNAKLTGDSALFENVSDEDGIAMFDLLDNDGNNAETSYKLMMNWLKDQSASPAPKAEVKQEPAAQTPVAENNAPAAPANAPEVAPNATPVAETYAATDVATDAPSTKESEKVFDRILPKQTKTIEINGKSYTLENASKTANNFVYYTKGDTLIIEGSDLKLTAADNADIKDNVKLMGNRNTIDMGEGDDIVEVEGDMNMIYGGSGNDHIKMRGDYNTTDMSDGDDVVWMAGNNNTAMGQNGADNFFAIGNENTFFGQNGVDASYYNEAEGIGHEFRVENKITDASDFEKWVKGDDDDDGPPYDKLPDALDGHEVRAYDDNTYTDKYEQEPLYYTEYRDIAYRELDAMTTENKVTGEGSVLRYNDDGSESSNVTIAPDGGVTVAKDGETTTIAKKDVVYYDADGNAVANPGSLSDILEKLATGKLAVGTKDGVVSTDKPGTGGEVTPPVTEPDEPVTPPVDPEVPDEPVTPPVEPEVPDEPAAPLPTTTDIATLTAGFNTSIDDALKSAGDEYLAAMSNKNADGTFNTADDAAASQKYAATVNTLNTKKNVVINKGLPLINTASNIYAGAADKTDDYYTRLHDLVMKTLEANRKYFENKDTEAEGDLKAEADKANAELEALVDAKP